MATYNQPSLTLFARHSSRSDLAAAETAPTSRPASLSLQHVGLSPVRPTCSLSDGTPCVWSVLPKKFHDTAGEIFDVLSLLSNDQMKKDLLLFSHGASVNFQPKNVPCREAGWQWYWIREAMVWGNDGLPDEA